MLLMLEDDAERIERFTRTLAGIAPDLPLILWRNAHRMIAELPQYLPKAVLLSLDHDLEPEQEGEDPGDGLLVVKYLVSQEIVRPVIIHSSNRERATWMAGDFELERWRSYRVAPLGDDWIELDWRLRVTKLLRSTNRAQSADRRG
jgi:hypothetical protein